MRLVSRWTEFDWRFVVAGFCGTLLVGASSPALVSSEPKWWFSSPFGSAKTTNTVILYAGVIVTIAAWLALGRHLSQRSSVRTRSFIAIVVVWSVPLVVAPPLFSGDVYSYLAQGTLMHLGLNPYHVTPADLNHLHHAVLANAVSPFWRNSTSPYGPLFIGAMSLVATLTSSVDLGVIIARLIELLGVVAFALAVARIARNTSANPARALWLCCLSPLALFGLIAPGHNDALMVGIMALGVACALERRPLIGIGLCMVAAAIKAPAAIAGAVILICWLRENESRSARWRNGGLAVLVSLCVLAAASFATGLGLAWLSPSVLATPGRVHLAITPVSELAWFVHAADSAISIHTAQGVIGKGALSIAAAIALWLIWRVRSSSLVRRCGLILITFAALGPAAWPWYFTWGIALIASDPQYQRSALLIVGIVTGALVIKPDGILALPYSAAPYVALAYITLGSILLTRFRHHAKAGAAIPNERPATNTSP